MTIDFSERDAAVVIEVTDTGAGFEVSSVSSSRGLLNMADRVEALDGTLDVQSSPGDGTTVRAAVPVAIDLEGRRRPEWAERLTRRPLRSKRVSAAAWTDQPGWAALIRKLASHLGDRGRPVAVAAFRIGD